MNSPLFLLFVYCFLILIASIAGGLVPIYVRLTHRRMEFAVSFVAGIMLGVGLLHLLAHALTAVSKPGASGTIDGVMQWLLVGTLVMFFFERFFCYHHHDVPDVQEDQAATQPPCPAPLQQAHCNHQHETNHDMSWSGAAFGLTLHSMVAGIALAASVAHEFGTYRLAGISTFIVIFLHKPFDSLTIGTLMAKGRWPYKARHIVNALFALAIPLGAVLFQVGILRNMAADSPALPYSIAFAAGTFLCIAMSDILPELQFHSHDRFKLSLALLLGLLSAWAVTWLETGHQH